MFSASAFIAENAALQFDSDQAKLDPLLWTQDKFERGLVELYFFTLSMILFVLPVLMQFCQNLAESVRNWIQDWSLQVTQWLCAEGDELDLKKGPVLAFPSSWTLFKECRGSLPERCCADQPGWSWGVLIPWLASIRSVCNACRVALPEPCQLHILKMDRSSSCVNKALNSSAC